MNIYCNSNGSIFHVDPSRVFQGSVGVDVVRFIGRFPSSAQVLMAYKLPNGTWTSPKMLTPVAELEEIQDANGGTFAVWEGRIGASPKIDPATGKIVKDEKGNIVFDLDPTITENYGTALIQFFVYGATAPITVNGVIQNVGNGMLATASFSFEIEKGVPALIPEVNTDDAQALLTQILNVVANTQTLYGNVSEDVTKLQEDVQDLDENKVDKSGDTMNGPLVVESQSGPGKVEVSEQGVFVTNDGKNGTAYDDGAIVNQGKIVVIPLKDGTMALAEDTVAKVIISIDESNYKVYVKAFDINGKQLDSSSSFIDLPLESMVVGGAYNDITHRIELTLQNGNIVSFPVDELVNGLISSSEKGQPNGVASLDSDGKVPKEQLPDDIGGGGESADLADYVRFTDYAGFDYDENTGSFIPKAGVIKVEYLDADFSISNGFLKLEPSTTPNIIQKNKQGAITPWNMDYAWRVSATTNTETFTDEEKANACETIGAVQRQPNNNNGWNRVYGMNSLGNECVYRLANGIQANTIVIRGVNGVVMCGTPSGDNDATTKAYVDGKIAELLARIEALENK